MERRAMRERFRQSAASLGLIAGGMILLLLITTCLTAQLSASTRQKDVKTASCIPMPISQAAAMLRDAHTEMAKRNSAGEYYLAMAITPGDCDKRTPARFWVFDYGPKTGLRWISYPKSLPGVYFKTTFQSVNGHYPEIYLSENGDVVSLQSKEGLSMPANPTLVAWGSTTVKCHIFDDLGNNKDFMLSPQLSPEENPQQSRRPD